MKYETKSKTTTVDRGGELDYAKLCKLLKAPVEATIVVITATHKITLAPHDVVSVSFTENVKPRAKKAAA